MATDAVWRTHWRHRHTDRAAHYHWLLTHHGLRLISHTRLSLRWVLLWILRWRVLRLPVGLWLLRILGLSVCRLIGLLLWRILSWRRSVAGIAGLCHRRWCPELITTACTEAYARVILMAAVGTKSACRGSWRVHVLSTTAAESIICGNFCLAGRTTKSCRL